MTDPVSPAPRLPKAANTPGTELEDVRADAVRLDQELVKRDRQAHDLATRNNLAAEELQHRARNTMALVRSAFKRTMETGSSLEDVEMHFCGRLDVLAHYMLPRLDQWDARIDVESVIRNELRNFEFGDAPGITIQGPEATLSLEQTQSFALAIHELTTNALKFGALAVRNARLSVTWDLHDGFLKLVWDEAGVPIVGLTPVHKGFGQEYIEDALPYQIGAITQFMRKAGGVFCTIEIPLKPSHANEAS